jgi:uncharacterized repeat protein (TIGR02543 family)
MTKKNISFFIGLNMALIALWSCDGMATLFHGPKPEEAVPTFTLTFDANEATGAAPSPQRVNSGTVITMPGEGGLAKGDRVFTGWNVSKSGGGTSYPPESPYTVTADQTFYAQWTDPAQIYTVTYHANGAGGTPPAAQKVLQGGSISVADKGSLTNGNKVFDGWNIQADGSGSRYTAGATLAVTGNTTLYAQWVDPTVQRYTVTYLANGANGTPPAAQTVNEGSNITLPGAGGLTNNGKTFNGWNTAANGSGNVYAEGASYTVNANTSFYAQWISAPITPPGATLAEKLAYIAGRADDGTVYDIEVTQNEYLGPTMVATQGRNVVVNLQSADAGDIKTIQVMSTGTLLTVNNNITLTLQNITLKGRPGNDTVLVKVASGGAMIMNQNAKISDNTSSASTLPTFIGAGLCIDGGSVTMNDGEISGNTIASGYGGGVYVNGGIMVINGGKITGNNAYDGGGIFIGIIGTGISSTVTMHGGEISNNTVPANDKWGGYGGGIRVYNGHFSKTSISTDGKSGVIYGSSAGPGLANIATRGAAIDGPTIREDTLGQFDEY